MLLKTAGHSMKRLSYVNLCVCVDWLVGPRTEQSGSLASALFQQEAWVAEDQLSMLVVGDGIGWSGSSTDAYHRIPIVWIDDVNHWIVWSSRDYFRDRRNIAECGVKQQQQKKIPCCDSAICNQVIINVSLQSRRRIGLQQPMLALKGD